MHLQYLKSILSVQSVTGNQYRTFGFVVRELKRLNVPFYVSDGCIYATKGSADYYPCVVAHLDTVHDIIADFQVFDNGKYLFAMDGKTMEQTGIGGDDKVGIYIALTMLQKFENIKVAFFRDEEHGCLGSYYADLDFFYDTGFVLQCDRKGYGDFVTEISGTVLSSKEFKKAIKPTLENYQHKFCSGGMTDILALCEIGIGVSVANISCGYYRPHSDTEIVCISDVARVEMLVADLINVLGCKEYKHKVSKHYKPYRKEYKAAKTSWDKTDSSWDSWADYDLKRERALKRLEQFETECEGCGTVHKENDLTFISDVNMYLCGGCKSYFED